MRLRSFLVSSALIWTSIATPATAGILQPTTNWAVDYGETQCTAARSFGSASKPITLGIVPSLSGDSYKLIVSREQTGPRYAQEKSGTVDFGQGKIKTLLLYYGVAGVKMTADQFRITAAQLEQARNADRVSLASDSGQIYQFALSDMPALVDALRKCTTDLQQYWNLGSTAAHAVTKKAVGGDLRTLFSPDDYPTEALMRGQSGTAQYELQIDEKGNVAGCDVSHQSGIPILDVIGCQVMKQRAKFAPATDANGTPVRSVVVTPPVSWRVGGSSPGLGPTLSGRRVSDTVMDPGQQPQ